MSTGSPPKSPELAISKRDAVASPHEWWTFGALTLLIFIWAANFSIAKFALADISPLAFNGLRFALASLLLYLFVSLSRTKVRMARRHVPALIALGVLGNTVYQVLFIYGLDWTLAGNAALMLATTPIFTTILSVSFGQERVGRLAWGGVAVSFIGIALVVWGGSRGVQFGSDTVRGDLTTLAASLAWSSYTVGSSPLVRRYGPVPVTAVTMWIGGLGLLAVSAPSIVAQEWSTVRPMSWVALLFSGTFAIAVAYLLWYYSIKRLGNTRTAVYTNFIPVMALIIAWLVLAEVPTWLQLLGAAGILGGTLMVRLGKIEGPYPPRYPAE